MDNKMKFKSKDNKVKFIYQMGLNDNYYQQLQKYMQKDQDFPLVKKLKLE